MCFSLNNYPNTRYRFSSKVLIQWESITHHGSCTQIVKCFCLHLYSSNTNPRNKKAAFSGGYTHHVANTTVLVILAIRHTYTLYTYSFNTHEYSGSISGFKVHTWVLKVRRHMSVTGTAEGRQHRYNFIHNHHVLLF